MKIEKMIFVFMLFISASAVIGFEEINCNFEEDLCGIKTDKKAGGRWIRQPGSSVGYNDHTYGNTTGFFLSVYTTYARARIQTKKYRSASGDLPKCLTFWYKMFNSYRYSSDGFLRVYQAYNDTYYGEPIWEAKGNLGNVWRPIELDLTDNEGDFKIVIQGERPRGTSISIDDLVISGENCPGTYGPDPDVSCDFEDNLCGYQSDPTVDVDWIRQQADEGISGDGPDEDHTFGINYGHYLCVNPDTLPRLTGHRARIISPIQNTTEDVYDYCILFWYYVSGSNLGKLKIFVEQNDNKKLMVNIQNDQGTSWHRGSFQITNTDDPFKLIFEAIRGREPTEGSFCIDDVEVLNGTCPIQHTTVTPTEPPPTKRTWQVVNIEDAGCTFEEDCGYGPYDETGATWTVLAAPSSTISVPQDHTIGEYGHFMSPKQPWQAGIRHRLRTPYIYSSSSTTNCLTFYYHCRSYHDCYNTFIHIYVVKQKYIDELPVDPLRSIGVTAYEKWQAFQIDLPQMEDNFTVVFEAVSGSQMRIAIDDIVFYGHECSEVKPEPFVSTIDCDFEVDVMCGYTQSKHERLDWIRHNGSTPSVGTGPENDHTYNTTDGHYIYVEASRPASNGQSAAIITPTVRLLNEPMCLQYWYHMNGDVRGQLVIRPKSLNIPWSTSLAAHATNQPGWRHNAIDINNERQYNEFVKFEFIATIGNGYKGDIAIDDIKLLPRSCQIPIPAVTYSYCSFKSSPYDCNYQDYDRFSWLPWKHLDASNPKDAASIATSMSKGMNSFLYADSKQYGRDVTITTPKMKPAKRYCLQLKYVLKQDFGLKIKYLYSYYSYHPFVSLKQIAPSWTRYSGELESPKPDQEFSILFDAIPGSAINGLVAIDDVLITQGHCPEQEVVDKIDCDFEKDCEFSTNRDLYNSWKLSNKEIHNTAKLPNVDNTKGTPIGHYYYISFRYEQQLTERNFLRTPMIRKSSHKRCLQFYYYLDSTAVSSLYVYVDDGSVKRFPTDPIWAAVGKHGNKWNRAMVDIDQTKGNYSIVFEPRSGGGKNVDIALDDVIVFNNKCTKVSERKWKSTIDCNFEKETICGYKHVQTRTPDFTWTRHGGPTKTKNSGPSHDHTYLLSDTTEGHYMYIETSPPRGPLDAAEISSPLLPPSPDSECLHFWYHMKGMSTGSLNVYRLTPAVNERKLLWSKTGEQSDHWQKAIVPLNVKRYFRNGSKELLDRSMKVHFRGIVGYGFEGDIAIDDVKVVKMSCDPPPENLPANETSCDFENGIKKCKFEDNTQEEDASGDGGDSNLLDWTFFNATLIDKSQSGESNDTNIILAQNQSSYIFADAANLKTGQRVVVTSPDIAAGSYYCLHYSYVSTGDFITDIYTKSLSGKVSVIHALSRKQQATWRKQMVNVPPQSEIFTVVFESMVGIERTGFIALDDIIVENGKCPTESPESPQSVIKEKTTEKPVVNESSSTVAIIAVLSIFVVISVVLLVFVIVLYRGRSKVPHVDVKEEDELKEVEAVDQA